MDSTSETGRVKESCRLMISPASSDMNAPATLVIRPEKLGDLVVATPVFKALKQQYPESPLHLLTDTTFADVVKNDPHIDRVITVRWTGRNRAQRETWSQIFQKLKGTKYARAAILYNNVEAWNWLMLLLGVREVAQLGGTYSAILMRHQMVLRKGHKDRRHYSEWFLEVARRIGARVTDTQPRLYVTPEEIAAFKAKFPFMNDPGRKVIIHPFNHGTAPRFSIPSYVRLADLLTAQPGWRVFITGTAREALQFPEVPNAKVDRAWLGTISVREWVVASKLADLVISGATGVTHAAAAVGANVLAIYCPYIGGRPDVWGPRGPNSVCMVAPESFCNRDRIGPRESPCTGDNNCDLSLAISPEQAAAKAVALLAGHNLNDAGSPDNLS